MLTVNVNLEDRFVNRLVGIDMDFKVDISWYRYGLTSTMY